MTDETKKMKVSARNQFRGQVTAVEPGAVNALVRIAIGGGDSLVAVVTLDSVAALDLEVGREVVAIVKAPWVMLTTDPALRLSARNQLKGQVAAVDIGAVNAEVTLALAGGSEIVSVVTREAVTELGLAPGVEATAVIKSSSVILGVPA